MPMRVSQLKGPTRTISVDVEDENGNVGPDDKIKLTYRPGELTLEVSDKIKAAMSSGFEGDIAGLVLEPVIKGWDILDDDGNPLPCNAETLKQLPLPVLGLFMQALYEDIKPDPQTPGPSDSTSNSTEEQDGSRTGSSFSGRPTDSGVALGTS